jgi:hypothetical protein
MGPDTLKPTGSKTPDLSSPTCHFVFLTGHLELARCCERRVDSPDSKLCSSPRDKHWSCHASPRRISAPRMAWRHTGRLPDAETLTHGFPLIEHFLRKTAKIIGRISLIPWLAMGPFAANTTPCGGWAFQNATLSVLFASNPSYESESTTYLRLAEPDSWPRLRISSDLLDLGHSQ